MLCGNHAQTTSYKTFEALLPRPDYEWIDEKMLKAGATRYRGIAGDGVIYVTKPVNNHISFLEIKGNSCTEIKVYSTYLAFDDNSVTMNNEYLWDDAFKYKRKEVFAESCKSVESLIENFENGGFTAIFKDEILGL